MSQVPPYPPPPPPSPSTPGGFGPGPYPVPPKPSNGSAIAAMVLGSVAAGLAILPYVNLIGVVAALVGVVLGPIGVAVGRRTGSGTTLAIAGTALCLVAIGASVFVTWTAHRYLADLLDTVDPPAASADVGEEFDTDDGALTVRVTEVSCTPEEASASYRDCSFTFVVRNNQDTEQYLDSVRVKAVVDQEWQDPVLSGTTSVAPGATATVTGQVGVSGSLDGLAFDADDASSHSAVVVDVSDGR